MQKVTIKDIASLAGVSVGTVSKVLNKDQTVKEKNQQAVENSIRILNYNVNNVARSLARKPIKLGIVLPYPFEEYFGPMVSGIQNGIASLSDYKVSAEFCNCPLYSDDEQILDCLYKLVDKGVNGILLGPFQNFTRVDELEKLESRGIPVILLLSDIRSSKCLAYVGVDAALSGKTAADLAKLILKPSEHAVVFLGNKNVEEHRTKAISFTCQLRDSIGIHADIYETQDDSELAYQLAVNNLNTNPHLRLIYVATANSVPVCKAICDCGRANEVKVIATDVWTELKDYVEQRIVVGALDQHLVEQGDIAVKTLHQYLIGNIIKNRETKIAPSMLLYSGMIDKIYRLG